MNNLFTPVCFNQLYEVIKFLPWVDLIKINSMNRDVYDYCKENRLVQTLFAEKYQMTIKRYQNDHHFNPNILIHKDNGNGIVRKWENKKGQIVGKYKLDGSMKLEEMTDDIVACFCFTSLHDRNYELYKTIYETKLPSVKEVRFSSRIYSDDITEIIKSSTAVPIVPTNYHELFSIIGSEIGYGEEEPIIIGQNDEKKYKVYFYPDSVCLDLKVYDDVIYFGYYR